MATKIEIELLTEIKDAVKGLNQFQSEANKTFKEVEQSVQGTNKQLNSFSTNLKNAFSVAGGVIIAKVFQEAANLIRNAAAEAVDAAIAQEEAINRLNTALRISGRFSEAASKDIQDFATSLQDVINVSDEVILDVASLIQSFVNLDKNALKSATQATIDFATTFRLDFESASRIVGKALQGNVDALKRYGISVKAGANETETFNNVLTALADKSLGSAEAATKGYAGSLAAVSVQYGELLETVGRFVTENEAIKASFRTTAEAIKQINTALSTIKPQVEAVINAFVSISSSVGGVFLDIINVVIKFIGDFKSLFNTISNSAEQVALIFKGAFLKALIGVNELIETIISNLSKLTGTDIGSFLGIDTKRNIEDINKALEENNKRLGAIADANKKAREEEKRRSKDAVIGARDQSRALQDLQKEIIKTNSLFAESLKKAVVQIQFVADDSGEAAGKKTGKQFGGTFLSTLIDSFLPGFGKFISDIVGALSGKSQEAADEFIGGFKVGLISGIGDIVIAFIRGFIGVINSKSFSDSGIADVFGSLAEEIIAAIPAFFEALANSIVDILSEGTLAFKIVVAIIRGLIRGFQRVGPEGFEGFGSRVVKSIVRGLFGVDIDKEAMKLRLKLLPLFQVLFEQFGDLGAQVNNLFSGQVIEQFKAGIIFAGKSFAISVSQSGQSFIANVVSGADQFVTKAAEGIGAALSGAAPSAPSVPGFGGGGGGGFQLPNLPFFADGGRVPDLAQFKNDGLVARVSAGEQILSEDLSAKLDEFLQGSSAPQPVTVNLRLGESEIARVLLNLNRQGFRTT